MFSNIGKKIKGLAVAFCWLLVCASVIGGFEIASSASFLVIWGVLLILFGPVVAWILSWGIYGFGELIDKTCDIERHMRTGSGEIATRPNMASTGSLVNGVEESKVEQPIYSTPEKREFTEQESPTQEGTSPDADKMQPVVTWIIVGVLAVLVIVSISLSF